MEEATFEENISLLILSPTSEILQRVISSLEDKQNEEIHHLISSDFSSWLRLEKWSWEILRRDCRSWQEGNEDEYESYWELFSILSIINRKLIFSSIDTKTKSSLLLPPNIDIIDGIFEQIIERDDDPNNHFLSMINYWFDNLAVLLFRHIQLASIPIIIHINERLIRDFLLSEPFQAYFLHVKQATANFNITVKQEFYLSIVPLFLNTYFHTKPSNLFFTAKQTLEYLGQDFSIILSSHSSTISSWTAEFLLCLTRLTGLIASCQWCEVANEQIFQLFVPPHQTIYDYFLFLIEIISYRPFHEQIDNQWSNAETMLIDHILTIFLIVPYSQEFVAFFRAQTKLLETLIIFDHVHNDRINLLTYRFQTEILTEKQIKQLNIATNINEIFFHYLQHASNNPLKIHNKIPIEELLKGLLYLSKNDLLKNTMANSTQLSFLIDLADTYPIIYDIFWSLSFHNGIRERLMNNEIFQHKLNQLDKHCHNDQMKKILFGLRWNLNLNQLCREKSSSSTVDQFDLMISYSHKDKVLGQQIYDELLRYGLRVWIDVNDMHGNMMDAMAQAIEKSNSILLCISDEYQRSNLCRAEAQYAFKRQLKIIPVVVQHAYKPDGWLLFLTAGLIYIDFHKYPFAQAMQMLLHEIKISDRITTEARLFEPVEHTTDRQASLTTERSPDIHQWSSNDVKQWLLEHNLFQMAQLLSDLNGSSLIHLSEMMHSRLSQENLTVFQQDSMRKTGRALSLIELARFHSLMEEEIHAPRQAKKWNSSMCCLIM